MPRHFISYSSVDAKAFALRLRDALETGSPPMPVWLDRRDIRPGQDWDKEIVEALKTCISFLFVMTRDSVEDGSVCKREWARALKYRKPIVPIKLHTDAEAPFRLDSLQHIDFTRAFKPNEEFSDEEFDAAITYLRKHLEWLASPGGALQTLRDSLAAAERDLRHTNDAAKQELIKDEIEQLKKDIAEHEAAYDSQVDVRPAEESESLAETAARNDAPSDDTPPRSWKSGERLDVIVNVLLMLAVVIVALLFGARLRSTTIDLATIPEGSFQMGSSDGHDNEQPAHHVKFDKPFLIGRHEVTQAEWLALMDDNPSEEKADALPVMNVSWAKAEEFVSRLNRLQDGYIYYLPSESEWEYACRVRPADGGRRLSGMHDGPWEWCADYYHEVYNHAPKDWRPWMSESDGEDRLRMMRGGSCQGDADKCRCSFRNWGLPSDVSPKNAGFRVAAQLAYAFER
jgi:formylglycine-generating enzyme required for sulfatase activity